MLRNLIAIAAFGLLPLAQSDPLEVGGYDKNGVSLNGVSFGRGGWDGNGVRLNGTGAGNGIVVGNGTRVGNDNGVGNGEGVAAGAYELGDVHLVGGKLTR